MLNEKIVRELVAYSCGVQIPNPKTLCGYAAEVIEQLQRENEHLTEENRRMKNAAYLQQQTFTLKNLFRGKLISPEQDVCLCEHIDQETSKTSWRGPFKEIPYPYVSRTVEQIFVPCNAADLERYRATLYILLAPES